MGSAAPSRPGRGLGAPDAGGLGPKLVIVVGRASEPRRQGLPVPSEAELAAPVNDDPGPGLRQRAGGPTRPPGVPGPAGLWAPTNAARRAEQLHPSILTHLPAAHASAFEPQATVQVVQAFSFLMHHTLTASGSKTVGAERQAARTVFHSRDRLGANVERRVGGRAIGAEPLQLVARLTVRLRACTIRVVLHRNHQQFSCNAVECLRNRNEVGWVGGWVGGDA